MKNDADDVEAPMRSGMEAGSIPEGVRQAVGSILGYLDFPVALSTASDLTLDGFYGESWLVVAAGRLFVVEPDREEPVQQVVPLSKVRSLRVRHFYGNGVIEVSLKNEVIDLLRFSRSCADEMTRVGEKLTKITREAAGADLEVEVVEESGESGNTNRCQRCGRTIPNDMRICPNCIEKTKIFRRLMDYIRPYKGLAIVALSLSVVWTVLAMLPQVLTKLLVDEVFIEKKEYLLTWLIVSLIATFGLKSLVGGWRGYLTALLGQKVLFDLRTNLYDHLQKLSVNFFDKRQTGAIMSRVIGDVNQLQNFLSQGLQDVLIQFFTIIVICVFLFATNVKLAVIALLPIPVVMVATVYFNKLIRKVWHRVRRRSSELNAILGDTLPGIRVVKAFGRERNEVERFTEKQKEFLESVMQAALMSNRFYPAIGFFIAFGVMAIWGIGGRQVIEGLQNPAAATFTLGDLMLFTGLLWQLYGPIQRLSQLSGMLQQAATSAERIFEILDNQPERPDTDKPVVLNSIKGEISFENVSFEYEKGERVLDGVNIHIKPGEMIGLVGASGSGKTTLINLLSRFYRVTEGSIKIDGMDINQVEIKSLRDQMAVVLQEPFLFHATIAENIAYGKPDATREEIIWAAKMANAHEFISEFPDKYDTVLGERGTGLSGGQKQRISIARAILRNPRILILDEATSAVDTVTESLIEGAIDRLVQNRTTVAIAHRLSTLKNADRIIVMSDGRVVEQGTHAELLAKDGAFARLVRMQSEIAKQGITNSDLDEVV